MNNRSGKTSSVSALQNGEALINWFVVQTVGFTEKLVASELTARGFDAYSPLQIFSKLERGHQVMAARPLFPGYVFAGCERPDEMWFRSLAARGVKNVMMVGRKPAIVSETALLQIRRVEEALLAELQLEMLSPCPFKAGEKVKAVLGGVEVEAIFQEKLGKKRVAILMGALLGGGRVILETSKVSKSA